MGEDLNIKSLLSGWEPGLSLPQALYADPRVFDVDRRKVIERCWHLVGHESRLSAAGQYFIARIAGESLIICRDRHDKVNAFYNVCRHRGSLICLKDEGKTNRLVCPYHAWSWSLDGALQSAKDMPDNFDAAKNGLKALRVHVCEGLIFVAFTDAAGDFDDIYAKGIELLKPYQIDKTKIARRKMYSTPANWKLVFENFIECYHCVPSHPEYITIHSKQKLRAFGAGPGSGDPEDIAAFEGEMNAWVERARACNMPTEAWVDTDPKSPYLRQAARLPIRPGFDTESRDGKLMAPLLGQYRESDGGQTAVCFSPLYIILVNPDHAVIFRFTPIGVMETEVELTWLVRNDAEEGRDYDGDTLMWAWDVTNLQDGEIVTNNQKGILSSAYEPGVYSKMEAGTRHFTEWYLDKICSP